MKKSVEILIINKINIIYCILIVSSCLRIELSSQTMLHNHHHWIENILILDIVDPFIT